MDQGEDEERQQVPYIPGSVAKTLEKQVEHVAKVRHPAREIARHNVLHAGETGGNDYKEERAKDLSTSNHYRPLINGRCEQYSFVANNATLI